MESEYDDLGDAVVVLEEENGYQSQLQNQQDGYLTGHKDEDLIAPEVGDCIDFQAQIEASNPSIRPVCIELIHDKVTSLHYTDFLSPCLFANPAIGTLCANKEELIIANKVFDKSPQRRGYMAVLNPDPPDDYGPIIMSQIKNQYGPIEWEIGAPGKAKWFSNMVVGLGNSVPWIMSKQENSPDLIIDTCNGCYCEGFIPNKPYKPKMWTEVWTGWYTEFGDPVLCRPAEDLAFSVVRFIQNNGTFFNYYTYHWGTNFGWDSAGLFIAASCNYNAPLDENGLQREPKWGHLRLLHEAIKRCEPALVSAYPIVWFLGKNLEARELRPNSGCAAFLSNYDAESWAKVTYFNMQYDLPPCSTSIIPNSKNEVFNMATISSHDVHMTMLLVDGVFPWQLYNEEAPTAGDSDTLAMVGLYELINVTKSSSYYLWYLTYMNIESDEAFLKNGQDPVLTIILTGQFNVQVFPTILVFSADKDNPSPYEGVRSAFTFKSFSLEQLKTNVSLPKVTEFYDQEIMEEKWGSAAICFVTFPPDILDSKVEGRNKYLKLLLSIAEKFKRNPCSNVWAAVGKQLELVSTEFFFTLILIPYLPIETVNTQFTKFDLEPGSLEIYICCLCGNGESEKTLNVFDQLKYNGSFLSLLIWNTAILGPIQVGHIDIWKQYAEMMDYGIVIGVEAGTSLIQAVSISNSDFFWQALKNRYVPNIVFKLLVFGTYREKNCCRVFGFNMDVTLLLMKFFYWVSLLNFFAACSWLNLFHRSTFNFLRLVLENKKTTDKLGFELEQTSCINELVEHMLPFNTSYIDTSQVGIIAIASPDCYWNAFVCSIMYKVTKFVISKMSKVKKKI